MHIRDLIGFNHVPHNSEESPKEDHRRKIARDIYSSRRGHGYPHGEDSKRAVSEICFRWLQNGQTGRGSSQFLQSVIHRHIKAGGCYL